MAKAAPGTSATKAGKVITVIYEDLRGKAHKSVWHLKDDAQIWEELRRHAGFGLVEAAEVWASLGSEGSDGDGKPLAIHVYTHLDQLIDGGVYVLGAPASPTTPAIIDAVRHELFKPSPHGLVGHRHDGEEPLGVALQRQLALWFPDGGFRDRPDLRVIQDAGGRAVVEVDAVVVGSGAAYVVASHKVRADCVQPVVQIAAAAERVAACSRDRACDNTNTLNEFRGKRIQPVFMAELVAPAIEARVQAKCRELGVQRFRRNGTAISTCTAWGPRPPSVHWQGGAETVD